MRIFHYCVGVVVLFMTSCSNSETENMLPETDVPIGFGVTVPTTSRTLISEANQMGSFKVWGWRTPQNQAVKGQVFNGTTVSYNENSAQHWTYSPLQSWVLYNSYDFYALYPDTLSCAGYNNAGQLSFDRLDIRQSGEYSTDLALDVMHAHHAVAVETTPPDRVLLTFGHLLTNVNISLQMDGSNGGDEMVVTNILLNGMNCVGSMQAGTWNTSEPSYLWDMLDTPQTMEVGNPKNCFANVLMIPQTLTEGQVTLYVVYSYKQQNSATTTTKILQTTLPAGEWVSGEKINYTGTVKVDNTIVFDTPQVESWGTEQVGGTIIIK